MSTNAVIDVAIGLILMYLLLSLVCTVVNEFISTSIGLRAKTLESSLAQILDVPVLKADFYNHGLIDGGSAAVKGQHVSYLSGRTFAMAVLGSLDPTKPLPAFADIESAVKNLPDSNIRDALLAAIVAAGGDITTLRDNVATWYDSTMERVSGVYTRYLKYISLGVGLAIAIAANADSVAVARALWDDGSLRAQMVQAASAMVASPPPGAANTAGGAPVKVSQVVEAIHDAESTLRPLPIGWNFSTPADADFSWPEKIGGLLMTALALSLGAPFWFDLLSKFMSLRGTGDKPAKTADT